MQDYTPYLQFCFVFLYLFGAFFSWYKQKNAKIIGICTVLASFFPFIIWNDSLPSQNFLERDLLAVGTLALFMTLLSVPPRKTLGATIPMLLLSQGGATLFFTAGSHMTMGLGWILSAFPVFLIESGIDTGPQNANTRSFTLAQVGSCIFMLMGLAGISMTSEVRSDTLPPMIIGSQILIIIAAFLRQGLFPAHLLHHSWYEKGSLPIAMVLTNAPMGLFVITKEVTFLRSHETSLLLFSWYLVASLLFYGLLSLVQKGLRGWTAFAQLFLWSLALLLWLTVGEEGAPAVRSLLIVLALVGSILTLLTWMIELRLGPEGSYPDGGLAGVMPVLSGVMLPVGLALVGLPLTAGYMSEELWLHESHHLPWPMLAVTLSGYILLGIGFYRQYSARVFGTAALPTTSDLCLREKISLMLLIIPLVLIGLVPRILLGA